MPNLQLEPKENLSSFRRIAIGTWRTAHDPSVYGTLALRAEKMLAYVEAFRQRTGKRLTLSHVMAKAVSITLSELPDANAILRFNRIYLRKNVGVFFQVALEDPETGEIDLSGATIFDAQDKTIEQIVDEFEAKVGSVRKREDKNLEGSRSLFKRIPFFMLNWMLDLIGWLSFTLNLDLRFAGIPQDPFGSAMITNIGSLGLEEAYVPLVPYSRVPLLVALGAVKEEPVVEGGAIVPGTILRAFVTFDHRVLDGMHAAKMSKTLRRVFADPEGELGALPLAVKETAAKEAVATEKIEKEVAVPLADETAEEKPAAKKRAASADETSDEKPAAKKRAVKKSEPAAKSKKKKKPQPVEGG